MQPPLFYAPAESLDGEWIKLPRDESRHAVKVLRLAVGSMVIVVDGLGNAYRAEMGNAASGNVKVRIHNRLRDFGEPAVRLTLAAGLSVGSKFDSVVQRGTELGVKRFVPLLTDKSRVKVDDPRRGRLRQKRLERTALAAVKQCRRSYLPDIALPTSFERFLKEHDSDDFGILFHAGREAGGLGQVSFERQAKRVTVAVGPESGFTETEVDQAEAAGFLVVTLGQRVLRTETAGPVTTALVMQRLGELS